MPRTGCNCRHIGGGLQAIGVGELYRRCGCVLLLNCMGLGTHDSHTISVLY